MKVFVDAETCIACGLCADDCPDVFEMGDDVAKVIANPVPEGAHDCTREALEDCPVDAITIEE